MDWTDHNAGFVEAAYAISVICVIALVLWIVQRDRARARQLKDTKD